EYEIEPAAGLRAPRAGEEVTELRHLGGRRPRAGDAAAAVQFARALAGEQADVDGGAGAGERQERHREVRVLDRETERGSQLMAVERAVARPAHPSRRQQRPGLAVILSAAGIAGAVAPEPDAAGAEKLGLPRGVEAAKAESVVGERHRTVRIAVAR